MSLLLLVASMCAAVLGAALVKSLLPVVGARGAATLRLCLAAAMLCVVFRVWRMRLPPGGWRHVLRYGLVLGLMNLSFYGALQRLPLGIAVALEFTGPLTVALWHSRRALDLLWVAMAVLGLSLLLPWRGTAAATVIDPLGILFALGAAACWALYILWGRQAGMLAGTGTVALGMMVGALVALPFGASAAWPALVSPALLATAFAVALLSSVLPATLEMWVLTRLPARVFGVSMSLEPAIAALIGLLLLGEQLAPQQYLAIGAIMIASGGATLAARDS